VYESYFHFTKKPFELLPNPDFLYPSKSHRKVLTYLDYGIRERSGFILLTGEVGTGKTTIVRELVKKHLKNVLLAKIFHTKVESLQLLAMINEEFGLAASGKDKPTLLRELHDFLIDQYAQKKPVALIIDEAQNLNADVLEEVRMLSNLETEDQKLVHIILVGQPELRRVLASKEMLQLRQRIQINCHIDPISLAETGDYILHRMQAAGNRDALAFGPECFSVISSYTKGIPRLLNILCDYILLDAFANETSQVSAQTIHEIARDVSFQAQYWESAPRPFPENAGAGGVTTNFGSANGKLLGVLTGLNRRLRSLEATVSKQNTLDANDIKESLDALTHRVEDLWQAMERVRAMQAATALSAPAVSGVPRQDDRPPLPAGAPSLLADGPAGPADGPVAPEDEPVAGENGSSHAPAPLPRSNASAHLPPWLKRLLSSGS